MGDSRKQAEGARIRWWPAPELLKSPVKFAKGAEIAAAGAQVRVLFFIEDGVVGRFLPSPHDEMLDGVRTRGWLLGVVPTLTGQPYGRVVALTDCILRALPIAVFRNAFSNAQVGRWIAELLADDVARQQLWISALAARSAPQLIEALFCELLSAAGRPLAGGGIRLTFDIAIVDIGRLIGFSREHTSRVLGELDAAGTLTRSKGWFTAPAGSPLLPRIRDRSDERV